MYKHEVLVQEILQSSQEVKLLNEVKLKQVINSFLAQKFQNSNLNLSQKRELAQSIFKLMRGFDILQDYLDDSSITEIMVNGYQKIFYEQRGLIVKSELQFRDQEHLDKFVGRLFGRANRLINQQNPIASMHMADGSRVQAILDPICQDGPILSIRRFTGILPDFTALLANQTVNQAILNYLEKAVKAKTNIFISGGTGTGKTTFLNALSTFIPNSERIVTIEDNLELQIQGINNLISLESRKAGPDGKGEISLKELIKTSLRLRPDRIILGEVRGAEALDMLNAMNTGHPGSMSTGHGNSPLEILDRICLMVISENTLPWEAVRRLVANSLELLIQIKRLKNGKRKVCEISELKGYQAGEFILKPVFKLIEKEDRWESY